MKQTPYMPFYPQDFLSSLDVQMMNVEEIGVYCLMLFNCWINGGKLPNNPEALRRLCRGIAPSELVLKKFDDDGSFLTNSRITSEIKKREKFSKEMSKASKRRWKKPENKASVGIADAIGRESFSLSSSLSLSSSKKGEPPTHKKEKVQLTETDREYFQQFADECTRYGVKNELTAVQYVLMKSEYEDKLQWWIETKGCIQWLHDKHMLVISAPRLRNRMKNAIKFNRERVLKQQQEYQDKKNVLAKPKIIHHYDAPWTPPA